MAALFLAHGLQCVAASAHDPVAMSHTLVAHIAVDNVLHHDSTGPESEPTVTAASLAEPFAKLGARDALGRLAAVCVAVLTAMGMWFLSTRKPVLIGRGAPFRRAGGLTSQLTAAARLRPLTLDLAVLCVLRT